MICIVNANEKLQPGDVMSLAVQTGLSFIPYVGGALQAAYFGAKDEKRFKRIESFYKDLGHDVEILRNIMATQSDLESVSDQISDFIEATNSIIESQSSHGKRQLLHNMFLNVLAGVRTVNWTENRFFMFTINQIDTIDVQILSGINRIPDDKWATVDTIIETISIDRFYLVGLLERLTNFGYLEKRLGNVVVDNLGTHIATYYRITGLGTSFLSFIAQPPVRNNTD